MRKKMRKLALGRETLRDLEDLSQLAGAVATEKTVCATYCVSNCPICQPSVLPRTCA